VQGNPQATPPADSLSDSYALRLMTESSTWWKRVLDVQAPYRWNLRHLHPGFVLDVGCGIGRNLSHLNGHGVGVDPNRACVAAARKAGLEAVTPEELDSLQAAQSRAFDSILVSHVLEHMPFEAAVDLVRQYLRYLKPGGQVIMITPQEAGHRSDATHVEFMDFGNLRRLASLLEFEVTRSYSFPFPRFVGRLFRYNEFVVTATRQG
jgi:2-polyprenyl-3-methyl-5-hydroxy-6-metoxy-1,4-benzoquinol methylase